MAVGRYDEIVYAAKSEALPDLAGAGTAAHPLQCRMSRWPSSRPKRVLAALLRIGWAVKRQTGSHRVLERAGSPDYVFAFHDREELGPRALARVAKHTRLKQGDW